MQIFLCSLKNLRKMKMRYKKRVSRGIPVLKNNNEIMQYYIIDNNIALVMHYHALLQMPDNIHSINDMIIYQPW